MSCYVERTASFGCSVMLLHLWGSGLISVVDNDKKLDIATKNSVVRGSWLCIQTLTVSTCLLYAEEDLCNFGYFR